MAGVLVQGGSSIIGTTLFGIWMMVWSHSPLHKNIDEYIHCPQTQTTQYSSGAKNPRLLNQAPTSQPLHLHTTPRTLPLSTSTTRTAPSLSLLPTATPPSTSSSPSSPTSPRRIQAARRAPNRRAVRRMGGTRSIRKAGMAQVGWWWIRRSIRGSSRSFIVRMESGPSWGVSDPFRMVCPFPSLSQLPKLTTNRSPHAPKIRLQTRLHFPQIRYETWVYPC